MQTLDAVREFIANSTSTPENRADFRRLVAPLRGDARSAPGSMEKIGSLESWGDIYYSVRKHERYGGADRVQHFMLTDCASLRRIFSRLGA